jgi:hypothetical protein
LFKVRTRGGAFEFVEATRDADDQITVYGTSGRGDVLVGFRIAELRGVDFGATISAMHRRASARR